jgi:hypothetical protein
VGVGCREERAMKEEENDVSAWLLMLSGIVLFVLMLLSVTRALWL